MQAFHDDAALKTFVLGQLAEHRAADKLVKGTYWENGKGCALGCTLEAVRLYKGPRSRIDHAAHSLYEKRLGIPTVLARLEDRIFERLSNADSQAWPERFIAAIRPGVDLALVWPRLALWLLNEELPQRATKFPQVTAALADVAALYREWCEGTKPTKERWIEARGKASEARRDAVAAADAAYAYAYAAAADAAAADAADAAADAADAAAYWRRLSDKLIELLEAA